jgi:hypothetical protein
MWLATNPMWENPVPPMLTVTFRQWIVSDAPAVVPPTVAALTVMDRRTIGRTTLSIAPQDLPFEAAVQPAPQAACGTASCEKHRRRHDRQQPRLEVDCVQRDRRAPRLRPAVTRRARVRCSARSRTRRSSSRRWRSGSPRERYRRATGGVTAGRAGRPILMERTFSSRAHARDGSSLFLLPVAGRNGPRRSLVGEGESGQGPTGTDMLTSAFAESTRAPRPAAAAYPGPDHGRLLAVEAVAQRSRWSACATGRWVRRC